MKHLPRYALALAALCSIPAAGVTQELEKCEKPPTKDKIQSFTVAFPGSIDDAYNATVEAFVTTGFIPNASTQIANQVQWTSGADYNALDGATRARFIRALVFAKGSGSSVNVSAFEEVSGDAANGVNAKADPLSNRNSGYGFKVWCAARRIADTLTAMASRVESDEPSDPAADTPASARAEQPAGEPFAPPAGSYSVAFLQLSDGGTSQRVAGTIVTVAFLPSHLEPQAGRLFESSDFESTSPQVILLSDHLWRERYKAIPAVVGMSVELGGKEAAVVGVLPPGFDIPSGVDLWVAKK